MIHIILSKSNNQLQNNIIQFIKTHIKGNNINYRIIFSEQHIRDKKIESIDKKDIILWHPLIAGSNLHLVKQYYNSIVILEKPTIYLQKISPNNPVNENMAINTGFYILYINPNDNDITNDEWKYVVSEELYIIKLETLLALVINDIGNIKSTQLYVPQIFENITDFVTNQTNITQSNNEHTRINKKTNRNKTTKPSS